MDERLERPCLNVATAIVAGFVTFVVAMWIRTGAPNIEHLIVLPLLLGVIVYGWVTAPTEETS